VRADLIPGPALLIALGLWIALGPPARAHDIPNARVDRSIQVDLSPGRLDVAYEVSLSELTLAQDLRALVGPLPGLDREALFDRYGRETGPLNAKGLLVSVDGGPVDLRARGFDLSVEEHPRYLFHFEATLPARGRLSLIDTNYAASEGASRLAVRGRASIEIRGYRGPSDVEQVPLRPTWQLSDEEERATKRADVEFAGPGPRTDSPPGSGPTRPEEGRSSGPPPPPAAGRLSGLLDRGRGLPVLVLWLLAVGLGAAHAIQPGHGKTLVAAAVVAERGGRFRGVALALVTTLAHTLVVLGVAAVLWGTRSTHYLGIHRGLAQVAGFAISAIGFWRLGRHLAGYGEHREGEVAPSVAGRSTLGLGVAGGLVPCWDAIVLIVVAETLGRLALGLLLLTGFSLGMAAVLVTVGSLAARLRGFLSRGAGASTWERRLGIASGSALAAIGLLLLGS
jgi:nickel/cobalt transporter (NicO) family protein